MPRTVLIADDDVALRNAIAIRCRKLGLTTRTSPDGLHAYGALTQEPPDLLILDVNMPGANGLYMCEELARDGRFAPIPVVILTGRSDAETVRRCQELGAHYVWKGLETWEQLEPIVRDLLELSPAAPGGGASRRPERQVRVLVVEDDAYLSKAIRIRLQAHGVQVVAAFNGMQGYWTALKERPDAIITDYQMPEGYGNFLLARLQNHSLTRDIPVIVLTGRKIEGRPDYALERELRSLGAADYLTKPLDFAALLGVLRRHVKIEPVTV